MPPKFKRDLISTLMANEPGVTDPVSEQKPLVLVVDDEYGPRESIAFTLSGEFTVETADRAADALARIRERPYAAVVMDIRMPEMDGVRALEELRKHDTDVSVIMLTGYGTLLTAQQTMAAGANQYLRKPPDVNELIDAVRKQTAATRLRRRQARIAKDAVELNTALKREVEKSEPQVWQGRASVELVHDLNNPLTVVIGYATLLVEEARQISLSDPERGRKLMEYAVVVERAAEYCHHLAENWRRTSKKLGDYEPIDLVGVIREVRQVIFFGNAAIQLGGAESAMVRGSKFELMRIFQNLLSNSLEAGAKRVEVAVSITAAGVDVSVRDDGSGMDPDDVKRALRGGFTSKASGTGLGLSICRHLLGAHGASFELSAERGRGTTVRSRFPVAVGA
jgi:signal transduction histidine kinase